MSRATIGRHFNLLRQPLLARPRYLHATKRLNRDVAVHSVAGAKPSANRARVPAVIAV